jgi:cysteine dioxygenase
MDQQGYASPLLRRCQALSDEPTLSVRQIAEVLEASQLCDETLARLRQPDPSRPYGRRVLIQSEVLESMLATWTPGDHCAPHDHGGSSGGVLVVRGTALHRRYRVADGRLEQVLEERLPQGSVITCGPNILHSMGDGGGEDSLVTLHLYTDPIDHMVVYDLENQRTLVVDGGCGAWTPYDQPELIRTRAEGIRTWSELGLRA